MTDRPDPADSATSEAPSDPTLDPEYRYLNREITWLAFNGRVLQEAMDPGVPVFDRLGFLAIFSSNLDEFFRVRVASLRSLLRLRKKKLKKLGFRPSRLLRDIHFIVTSQQELYGSTFRGSILPDLEANGVSLLNPRSLTPDQEAYLEEFFRDRIQSHLTPKVLEESSEIPFLQEGGNYLVVELWPDYETTLGSERPSYGLLEIPATVDRFVVVPGEGHAVIFVDDVIRLSLQGLFPEHEVGSAYAVKLSRDADLYLEDEFEGDLVERIRKSLGKRETGLPSRFLYDLQAPYGLVTFMKTHMGLEDEDLVPGGRYHNLQALFGFPRPRQTEGLLRPPLDPLPHPGLEGVSSILEAITEKDRLLHFPYQSYDYVVRFLEEAARDPSVDRIWITLYRVAEDSRVVKALIHAAQQGVEVTAFVEVQARFDEARNLKWAKEMETAGVRTLYSKPGIKVHAKLALVSRKGGEGSCLYAYLGTGNFNEKTSGIYADHGLLTADRRLTEDALEVFRFLCEETETPQCRHLLVAPHFLRAGFTDLVRAEMANARAGAPSGMLLKVNSLEDTGMIDLLYEASQAGVQIDLIVRGICRLRPGLPGLSENIRARSIVDRFLEHARIFRFVNGGDEKLFMASADWMKRNLDARVEVAFPVYDPDARAELEHILQLQLSDNTKARVLDSDQENHYPGKGAGEDSVEAQLGFYQWLEKRLES